MKGDAYIRLYGCVLELDITLTERVVLSYIADNCAWGEGVCARPVAQMCEDLNLSKYLVKDALRMLREKGYIEADESTLGGGRGNVTQIKIKGLNFYPLNGRKKGKEFTLFAEEKGLNSCDKRVKDLPFSEKKEKRSKKEKRINQKDQKESVSNARTRENAEAIIRDYERRRLDPNGTEWTPTAEEQARYEEARQVIRELDRAALVAEFKEVMAKYPDFAGWHQQPTVEQYAVLVERYGRADVAEALAYSANRLDLKWQYANPLAYVEMNIKNRRNRK